MRAVLFVLILLSLTCPAHSQGGDKGLLTLMKQYTDVDGLPQNSVNAIAGSPEGFMWFTTEGGLVRFDGDRFRLVPLSMSPGSPRFRHLLPVTDGGLLATNVADELLMVRKGKAIPDSTSGKSLLVEFKRIGLANAFFDYTVNNLNNPVMLGDTSGLIRMGKDSFVVWHQQTVRLYIDARLVFSVPFTGAEMNRFFVLGSAIYYNAGAGRILQIDQAGVHQVVLHCREELPAGVIRGLATGAFTMNPVNRSIVLLNSGPEIFLVRQDGADSLLLRKLVGDFDVVRHSVISSWYDGKTDALFMGSSTQGLFRFSRPVFRSGIDFPGNSGSTIFYSQFVFDSASVLSPQGGVFSPVTGRFTELPFPAAATMERSSVAIDQMGQVWTKKVNQLFRFQPGQYHTPLTFLVPQHIQSLFAVPSGLLYIGCREGGVFVKPVADSSTPRLLFTLPAVVACLARSGPLLYAGTESGLYTWNTVTRELIDVKGFAGMHVRSVYPDGSGNTWVTTFGNGWFLLNRSGVYAMPVDRNKFLLTAHCVIEDRNAFLWISTNKGLFRFSKPDLLRFRDARASQVYYAYFSRFNGLPTNEFNGGCQPCGVMLDNGWISFPSMHGLSFFDPSAALAPDPVEEVFVDEILVDNVPAVISGSVIVPRNMTQMKVLLSTPYSGNRENIRVSYRLSVVGHNAGNWLPVDESGVITFSTLAAGDYILGIRKLNGFGPDNYSETSMTFHVPSHWLAHPLMLLVYIGLLYLLLRGLVIARTGFIRRRNKLLQQGIALKTAELNKTLAELSSSQEELLRQAELQRRMVAVVSHDIRSPLKYLSLTTRVFCERLERGDTKELLDDGLSLGDHVNRLYFVVDNILQYIKTQIITDRISLDDVDASGIINGKLALYEGIARGQGTRLVTEVPAGTVIQTNATLFSVIIHNLLDNAVRVTENGLVRISFTETSGVRILEISDTGIGMGDEYLRLLNQQENENDREVLALENSGMGLFIVRDLAALLHIGIDASVHGGTVIRLRMPVAPLLQ